MRRRREQKQPLTFAQGKYQVIKRDSLNYQILKQHYRVNKESGEREYYYDNFGYFSSLSICFKVLLKDSLIAEGEKVTMAEVLQKIDTLQEEVRNLGSTDG